MNSKFIISMGIAVMSLAIGFILLMDVQHDKQASDDSSLDSSISTKSDVNQVQESTCLGTKLCVSEMVTKVVDGDTLYTNSYKIRLSLTNTPEKGETGFTEATDFTKNLCPIGSEILIDQDDKQPIDQYGRILAKVFCNKKILNAEILENNYGTILTQYCSQSEFSNEDWAKKFGC